MALVNETQLANLAKAILTETAPWLVPGSEAYEASWPKTKEYLKQIMTYLTVGGTGMGSGAVVTTNGGGIDTLGGTHVASVPPTVSPTNLAATGKVS